VQTFSPFDGGPVAGLGWNPDGQIVAVSPSGAVSLRKPYTGKQVGSSALQVPEGGALSLVLVSRSGGLVAGVLPDRAIGVWDVASGTLKHSFAGYSQAETLSLAFSADGKRLAIGWKNGTVRVHTLGQTGPSTGFGPGGEKHINALAFSHDTTAPWLRRRQGAQDPVGAPRQGPGARVQPGRSPARLGRRQRGHQAVEVRAP
jgi:WD40 repeat protein